MVPDVPTTAEAGLPGLIALNFMGVSGPAGMPPAVVARLQAEIAWALAQPSMLARMAQVGITPAGQDAAGFTAFVADQIATVGETVRAMNLTPQ
jgi:tripartite-type tricarboxylate transporter receptor subunit TctC